jgi:hypothetical protein
MKDQIFTYHFFLFLYKNTDMQFLYSSFTESFANTYSLKPFALNVYMCACVNVYIASYIIILM